MQETRIRLGFVGAGYMGQLAHIASYARLADCELVALAEGRRQLAQKVAETYGIKKVYPSHEDLAEDPEVDAVIAVMPYPVLYPVVKCCLRHKKHVFTEKPMASSHAQAGELVKLADENQLMYQVGYMKRHDKGVLCAKRELRNLIHEGAFGALTLVRVWCMGGDWMFAHGDCIRTAEEVPGYGLKAATPPAWLPEALFPLHDRLLNLETHTINLFRFLFEKEFDVLHVSHPLHDAFVISASMSMHDEDVPVVFACGHTTVPYWDEGMEIFFEHARMRIHSAPPMHEQSCAEVMLYLGRDIRRECAFRPQPVWSFLEQARHVLRCIRGEEPAVAPGSDALRDMALCERILQVAKQQIAALPGTPDHA